MTPEEYDRHYLSPEFKAARRNFHKLHARRIDGLVKRAKEEAIREAAILAEYERQMK